MFNPEKGAWVEPRKAKNLEADVAAISLSPEERWRRVKAASEMCGFQNLTDASAYTGVPVQAFHTLRRSTPKLHNIIRIALALNVSLDFLILKKGPDRG